MAGRHPQGDDGELGPLLDAHTYAIWQERLYGGRPEERALASRRALARSALELSGECGYRGMTVEALVARAGSNRDRLYRDFGSKDACWLSAYRAATGELVTRLLGAAVASEDWAEGMARGLGELADFLEAEPALARGLITGAYVAGPAALARRKEVSERLSRAIDRARRETGKPRHSPPPITSSFIVNGIETMVHRSLLTDVGDFRTQVPGLVAFAVVLYFGPDEARQRLGENC